MTRLCSVKDCLGCSGCWLTCRPAPVLRSTDHRNLLGFKVACCEKASRRNIFEFVRIPGRRHTSSVGSDCQFEVRLNSSNPSGMVIQNPGYPSYQNNMDCTWVVRAGENQRIRYQFEELSMESHSFCRYDYVETFDKVPTGWNRYGRCWQLDFKMFIFSIKKKYWIPFFM